MVPCFFLSCSEVSFFVKGGYRLYVEDDVRCVIIDKYMKLTSEFILFFPLISDKISYFWYV